MTKDMTTGPITPLLVNFTIPLVLGNLFQLTYNAVDSIIVGKFVGEDALAAVVHLEVRFLKLVSLFYLMPSLTNGIQGGFRGLGDLKITLNSSTLNMAGRVAAAAVFVLLMKTDIEALPYSYVVGWILMLVYEAPMMVKYLRKGELQA